MLASLLNNQTVVVGAAAPPVVTGVTRREVGRLMIVVNTAFNRDFELRDTDGAPVTGVAGSVVLSLWKNGTAIGPIAATVTELSNGAYKAALTTAHNDTIGSHTLYVTAPGAVAYFIYDQVVAADITTAQINAEVVDALATDAYAEPAQGIPAATTSLVAKINYLYKAWRNRSTQTATGYALYGDNASTVDQKATVSDDATTFDKGEVSSGP